MRTPTTDISANAPRRSVFTAFVAICLLITLSPSSVRAKVDGSTIVLGATVSLSGKYAILGLHTKNGYDLAVSTINERGGVTVNGKLFKLRVTYYDDQSDPKLGAKLTEQLIQDDGIKFMLGPYSSALTVAAAAVVEKFKIPMVESNGASQSIFSKNYKYVFGVLSTSDQYLNHVIDLAVSLERKLGKNAKELTLAIVVENDPFSLDVRSGAIKRADNFGIKVLIDERFPPNFGDSSKIFKKIKNLDPTILIVSGHSEGAIDAVRHIKDMKLDIPMIGMTHCEVSKVITKLRTATEGILCATQWSETLKYKGSVFSNARAFSRAYRRRHKDFKTVPYQAAEAAAAVIVWKDAFERAGTFDTVVLRNVIAQTDLQTFYGRVKFAKTGQNIAKPMVLRQVQKGKYRVVAPVEWASWPLVYPRKPIE